MTTDEPIQYGSDLPDQATQILAHCKEVVSSYADLEKYIDERSQLEREYAQKLQAITKKAVERKAKRGDAVWVGETSARSGSAASISLNQALESLLAGSDTAASHHSQLADQLSLKVVQVLREKEKHKESIRSRYGAFYNTMLEDRDGYYNDRTKAQSKYQAACTDLEAARQKHQSLVASSDKHVDRALKSLHAAQSTTAESKNAYLLEIEVSNGIKEKFYRADLPEFQDQLQAFHMASLGTVHQLLTATVGLQAQHLASLKTSLEQTTSTISAVDLGKDVEVYVRENRRVGGWKEPEGWGWEPAEGFYEVGEWATDGPAKVVLQNKLARANADLAKTQPNLDSKSTELSSLVTRLTQASAPSAYPSTSGDPDSVSDSLLPLLPEVHRLSSTVTACEVVLDQLQAALGEETGEGKAHEFKSASFTVPAKCKVCEGSIWGLAKPGKSCRNCGVVVHTKCENKIPANCARASASSSVSRRTSTASRVSRAPSTGSSLDRSLSTASSRPPPGVPPAGGGLVEEEEEEEPGRQVGVLFDYAQTSEFELSVQEGETVIVVEEDDGSGWVKVVNVQGSAGLVPATYLASETPRAPPPPVSLSSRPTQGPLKQFVTALYDYAAQGADELSLVEGEGIELSEVGKAYGEGWWEGVKDGRKGCFPSNYCQE